MALVVLLGGARSGKSRLAVELATGAGAPVTFVATAEGRDAEMRERIRVHRAERPKDWLTVEEPYALAEALAGADPHHMVVVDCLALWLANALERESDPETIVGAATTAAQIAARRPSHTVVVTNEVGLGIVPATPAGREYRDLLGTVNRLWVERCEEAFLVVAGRALPLSNADVLAPRLADGATP